MVGFSLLARPLRKQYATLSIWDGDEALNAFAEATPHAELVHHLAAEMAPSTVVRWTIEGSHPRPNWSDALERLRRTQPRDAAHRATPPVSRALDRVETLLEDREQWATDHGLHRAAVRQINQHLIRYFADLELDEWTTRS